MTVEQTKARLTVASWKTEKQVYSMLKKSGLIFEDARANGECEYFNVRIPADDGAVRIYAGRSGFTVQVMRSVEMTYSGIPVFFSTNSDF